MVGSVPSRRRMCLHSAGRVRLNRVACCSHSRCWRRPPPDDPFRFQDGDRVVWLGGTLIEREQQSGHWEAALTVKNRPAKVTFRNLGWSGDTVWGESRNGFDESPKGFERLVSLTTELKPTVLIVCYGQNESFAGEAGLAKFRDGLNKLLDALAPTKARVVLMTPTRVRVSARRQPTPATGC